MKCEEAIQWMSDAVDGRLPRDLRRPFFEHVQACRSCLREYEMEQLTKKAITKHLFPLSAPVDLKGRVVQQLASEAGSQPVVRRFRAAVATRAVRYSVAAVAAVLFILIGVNVLDHGSISPRDILASTQKNYEAMRQGTMKPEAIVYEPEEMQEYLQERASFNVVMPPVTECAYIAGLMSKLDGLQEAHILFKMDEVTYLYLYQVEYEKSIAKGLLQFPEESKPALRENKWFVKKLPDRTVMLWVSGETLCAAVSNMSESEMMEILSTDPPHPW